MNIEWNKVTRFSQTIAIILFFLVGALGFWLGSVYEEILNIREDVRSSDAQIMPFNNLENNKDHEKIRTTDWQVFLTERFKDTECEMMPVRVGQVQYGDLNHDGVEDAVVAYFTCWNGTGGGESEVFTLDYLGRPMRLLISNSNTLYDVGTGLLEGFGGRGQYMISSENQLVFSYPIYKAGDGNCCPTGGTRNIYYVWSVVTQQFEIEKVHIEQDEATY